MKNEFAGKTRLKGITECVTGKWAVIDHVATSADYSDRALPHLPAPLHRTRLKPD